MSEPLPENSRTGIFKFRKSVLVEVLLSLGIIVVINFLWFRDNLGFFEVHPHPYWIIVILASARYGFGAGFFAAFISSLAYLGLLKLNFEPFSIAVIIKKKYFTLPLFFMAAGVVVGEIREVQKRRFMQVSIEFKDMKNTLESLRKRYESLGRVKQEIDTRIISQEHTVSTLYESAHALKSLKESEIFSAALDLLREFLSATTSSFYILKNRKLSCAAAVAEGHSVSLPDYEIYDGMMGRALKTGETVSLNTLISAGAYEALEEGAFTISSPVLTSDKKILGVLNIGKLPFLKFNPQTIRMTSLIADWCGAAIENARKYQETMDKNIIDELTGMYTYKYSVNRLKEEFKRSIRYKIPLSIICCRIPGYRRLAENLKKSMMPVIGAVLKDKLREIDLSFHDRFPGCFIILLPNTPFAGARIVREKILKDIMEFKFSSDSKGEKPVEFVFGIAELSDDMKSVKALIEKGYGVKKE